MMPSFAFAPKSDVTMTGQSLKMRKFGQNLLFFQLRSKIDE